MPQIGEIKRGYELGYTYHNKFVWQACIDCGKERWVALKKGELGYKMCFNCANKIRSQNRKRERNGNWKGGQRYDDGYVFILKSEHPRAKSNNYVKRATLVLEQKLGRSLLPGMMAHHENGIRDDDRPENLSELSLGKHTALHNKERVSAY